MRRKRNTNFSLLCDIIYRSVVKCAVYKELKVWLRLEEMIFFSVRTGIVIDCFIEWMVGSQTQFYDVPVVVR
jgi:hypothetical protein